MRKRHFSIPAILVAAALTLYFVFQLVRFMFPKRTTSVQVQSTVFTRAVLPKSDTAFGGLFADTRINDSLPYYQYKRIEDSIRSIKERVDWDNKAIGSSISTGALGLAVVAGWPALSEIEEIRRSLADTLTTLAVQWEKATHPDSIAVLKKKYEATSADYLQRIKVLQEQAEKKRYYLSLNGYQTKDRMTRFFLDKGTYNLAYLVWDSKNGGGGHYERKSIPVRYDTDQQKVLVPLSPQVYPVVRVLFFIVLLCGGCLLLYFIAGLPVQVVISLARGEAFTQQNIQRFRQMAVAVLVFALLGTLVPYLLHWLFWNRIPPELVPTPFGQNLYNKLHLYFIALALFLIGQAFQRGYRLQQENALTI